MPDRQRLLADLWRLIEQDWRNIEAGIYARARGLAGRTARRLCAAPSISLPICARSRRAATASRTERAARRAATQQHYPEYYRRKFHFQSDGYLSEASAERYDYQVEVLFGGGAAAMRRQALVPLRDALRCPTARKRGGTAARYRLRHRRLPARRQAQPSRGSR